MENKITDKDIAETLKGTAEYLQRRAKKNERLPINEHILSDIANDCIEAADLINRQKAEIEGLENEIDKQYEQARADILGNMSDGGTSCHWCINQHQAEAIKKFAEKAVERVEKARLKYEGLCNEQGEIMEEYMHIHFNGIIRIINDLVKETAGEE